MSKEDKIPSDSEWRVMEVLWESGAPLPSSEIIKRLGEHGKMTSRMVRVLLNRLCQKELVDYIVDDKDARVYHYFSRKSRAECRREKSRRFVECYFAGSQTGAIASLLQSGTLTAEQIGELEALLEENKRKGEE
ncbi:MAG: BlaI/MecI/CopY family transcriptional regulator [Eubacterium sp.]|jgi:Predicted transcriptional regulator|nr:BlaI/MecI/CopY family transcriptional regulator [Eubacterium sp.]